MSNISVKVDVDMWLNSKGQMLLYFGEHVDAIESIPLIDLVKMEIDSRKVFGVDHLDRDEAKKLLKLKKALQHCIDHVNREIEAAK